MKLEAGLTINSRYVFKRKIASGGMGEVWLADDKRLNREVVVKALKEEHAGNVDFLTRLRVEARNNAVLSHQNIAALHDYIEIDKIGFIVMEYVEGKSFAQMLNERSVLPLKRLIPLLIQVAKALDFAHKHKIIHRDIKPANILVRTDGVVKVIDFGVSRASNQSNLTATGMVVGTAQYLSPEQAIGRDATELSDLYAIGIMAYEATVGKRPFNGKNAIEIAIAQVNAQVPNIGDIPDDVDDRFKKIILKLLDKDPKKRFATGEKLATELNSLYKIVKNTSKSRHKLTDKKTQSGSVKKNSADRVNTSNTSSKDYIKINKPDSKKPLHIKTSQKKSDNPSKELRYRHKTEVPVNSKTINSSKIKSQPKRKQKKQPDLGIIILSVFIVVIICIILLMLFALKMF